MHAALDAQTVAHPADGFGYHQPALVEVFG
jgi:hypothetical protein